MHCLTLSAPNSVLIALIILGRRPLGLRQSATCHPPTVPNPSAVSRDHKTKMFLHRREISVIVQQRVAMLDAEGADDDVGRLADRDAQFSELAIVPGGASG